MLDPATCSDEELSAEVDWAFGAREQFIEDDDRSKRISAALRSDDAKALRVLTAYVAKLTLPPFSIEDVATFVFFVDDRLGFAL